LELISARHIDCLILVIHRSPLLAPEPLSTTLWNDHSIKSQSQSRNPQIMKNAPENISFSNQSSNNINGRTFTRESGTLKLAQSNQQSQMNALSSMQKDM
jgi:hypothetical protein